jgi:hypothetical protein
MRRYGNRHPRNRLVQPAPHYATEFLCAGVDLVTVQHRHGHASIVATSGYLHHIESETYPPERLPY